MLLRFQFNGINFRTVTAEQAAVEIGKASDTVSILTVNNTASK